MSPTLRIALLVDPITVRLQGGQHAVELSAALMRRGHQVRLFGAPRELKSQAVQLSATTVAQPTVRAGVLSFRPDALIAYDALSPAAWLGSRVARRRGVPLVLVEPGALSLGTGFERFLWGVGGSLWGPLVRRTADLIVALDPVARELALRERFPTGKLLMLPHGVDLERFRPGLLSPLLARHRIRGRVLLHAGGREPREGLETLIVAFSQTVGRRGDWALVLAGDGRPPPRLRACAQRLGVGASVHFVPATDDDLPGLYSSSTLVAVPHDADLPGSTQVQRACASGKPVLASDLPRLRYLLEPDCGIFAAPGDAGAWTVALQRAALAPEARKRWGIAGLRSAQERLGWSRIAASFEEAILTCRKRGEPERAVPLAQPSEA